MPTANWRTMSPVPSKRQWMSDASLIGRVVAFMRIRRLTKAAAGAPRHRACAAGHDRSHRSQSCGTPPRPVASTSRAGRPDVRLALGHSGLGSVSRHRCDPCRDEGVGQAGAGRRGQALDTATVRSGLARCAFDAGDGERADLVDRRRASRCQLRAEGGELCREFNVTDAAGRYDGIACRKAARWTLRFAADLGGDVGQYKTADGDGLVQNFLTDINAGSPLPMNEEEVALRRLAGEAL